MTPDEILKILDKLSQEEELDSDESEEGEQATAGSDQQDEDESKNSDPKDSFMEGWNKNANSEG